MAPNSNLNSKAYNFTHAIVLAVGDFRATGDMDWSGPQQLWRNDGNVLERRFLRSRYLAVKDLISVGRDDISKSDSDKFRSIFDEVECLHQFVQKPREQVADAEALLDMTNTLMTSVKAQSSEGVTAEDFVSCLLKTFGHIGGDGARNSVKWK